MAICVLCIGKTIDGSLLNGRLYSYRACCFVWLTLYGFVSERYIVALQTFLFLSSML